MFVDSARFIPPSTLHSPFRDCSIQKPGHQQGPVASGHTHLREVDLVGNSTTVSSFLARKIVVSSLRLASKQIDRDTAPCPA